MIKTQQIVDMLNHFREKHEFTNQALRETGEGKRCKPFTTTQVKDIVKYCLEHEGVPEVLR